MTDKPLFPKTPSQEETKGEFREKRVIGHVCQVVNLKSEPFDVYIGRFNSAKGLPASKWANPFTIGKDGTREEVIAKYRVLRGKWWEKEVERSLSSGRSGR